MQDFDPKMVGPRAKADGKYELVHVTGTWIQRCRETRQQVRIVGKKVVKVFRIGYGIES